MSGSQVRMSSVTTIPRLTSSSAARAKSILGRMPIARTTRSAGINRASASCTPSTRSRPPTLPPLRTHQLLGLAIGEKGDAAPVEVALQHLAGGGVKLTFHQGGHQMHQRD